MDIFIVLFDGRILEMEKLISITFDENYCYLLSSEKLIRVRLDDIDSFEVL